MEAVELLRRVKAAVQELEPDAEIILYGSRARGDAKPDSDWDFLILVNGAAGTHRTSTIRRRLYDIEIETDEILSSIVRSRALWQTPLYQNMPFSQHVLHEGVLL